MKDRYILSEGGMMEYLEHVFGGEFVKLIDKPPEYRVGERVLYKMKDGQEPVRKEPTERDLQEIHALAKELAEKYGGTVISHPYITSGSSLVRLVDIPGWDFMLLPGKIIPYATGDDLEIEGFRIEWLLGLVFFRAEKMLFNVDFTHPRVRAMFAVTYEEEHSFIDTRKIVEWYRRYLGQLKRLKDELSANPGMDMKWAKLIQKEENLYFMVKHKRPD